MKMLNSYIRFFLSIIISCVLLSCSSDDNEGIFDANTSENDGGTITSGADDLDSSSSNFSNTTITISEEYLINVGEIYLIKSNGEFQSSTISSNGTASIGLPLNESYLLAIPNLINDEIVWDQNLKIILGLPATSSVAAIDGNLISIMASKNYLNNLSSNGFNSIITAGENLKLEGNDLADFQSMLSNINSEDYNTFIKAEVLKLGVLLNGEPLFNDDLFLSDQFTPRLDLNTIASNGQLLLEQLSDKLDFISGSTQALATKSLLEDTDIQASMIESIVIYSIDHDNSLTASSFFSSIFNSTQVFDDFSDSVAAFQANIDDFKNKIESSQVTRQDLLTSIKSSLSTSPISISIE